MKISCKAKVAGFRSKPGMTSKKNERMNNYPSTRFPEELTSYSAEAIKFAVSFLIVK